jgi:hypothetical protein
MHLHHVVPLCLATALVPCAAASAQFRTEAGDTLRYREWTLGTVTMQLPAGQVEVKTSHDAVLAVAFGEGGRADAWYEALALETGDEARGARRPHTEALIGRTFSLAIDRSGRVETLAVPEIPEAVSAVTDLTRQFEDFLVTVPDGELRSGREWADTAVHDRPGRPTDTYHSHRIRTYRVVGDTVIGGVTAKRIHVRQTITMEAASRIEEEDVTVVTRLAGTEDGTAFFAPATGRLLARTRTGELAGEMSVTGRAGTVSFPQEWTYRSRIEPVP